MTIAETITGVAAGCRMSGCRRHDAPGLARLGIYASGIKYDWLTAFCLEHADADVHLDYGRQRTIDPNARYAARAAALALCARWTDEAMRLARQLGLEP